MIETLQEKYWELQEFDNEKSLALQEQLKINKTLCDLLVIRGIDTYDEAKRFFRPSLEELHDPMLMKDMDKAVERIVLAINNQERILIFGDYDVDGTTAVSLVYSFLSKHFDQIEYYIPDRYKEGYGVSIAGIDYAIENNFTLMIALDCGVKAVDKVAYAKEHKVDFIICDHHTPGEVLPPAIAILDPKRPECEYPYKELSGCGIGFKLCLALCDALNVDTKDVFQYLDLLAVSIGADIVPMTGENRILAYYGLKEINSNPRPGISAFLKIAKVEKDMNITDVVFIIAPRINAAGRIDHGSKAVELLICEDPSLAMVLAESIDENNTDRRGIEQGITEEALNQLIDDNDFDEKKANVVYHEGWHKGVVGIVAARIIEKFYKPTIVLTLSNGKVVGSARSVSGFNIYDAIAACEDTLLQFGGHKYAAGLTMEVDQVENFKRKFETVVATTITEDQLKPRVRIDAELDLTNVNERFYNIINQMAPFGPGNMKPVFVTKGVRDTGMSRVVKDIHLKVEVSKQGIKKNGIAFGMAAFYEFLGNGVPVDVCYQLSLNEFRGYRNIQLMVKDFKVSEQD